MKIIYRSNIVVRLLSYILFLSLVWADPPNWVDTPGAYAFTASMTIAVFINGEALGDDGDMLGAFDESSNVRGVGTMHDGLGDYEGVTLYPIMLRSNSPPGDEISFKYYDASTDIIHDLEESYTFVINDIVGNLVDPHILSSPLPFTSNQSSLQSFYYFYSVTINGVSVDADDWVGTFNGNVCVGARKWDTSECGGGVCDLPVMGDNGSKATAGYMIAGDIPTFKIYDASENSYIDATPSEDIAWSDSAFPILDLLSAFATIPGCTYPEACNYDAYATEDDGSCTYAEENYDCDGYCFVDIDCNGQCGGSSEIDECGVCNGNGIPEGKCDCDGNIYDCAYNPDDTSTWEGACGGIAEVDECGVCDDYTFNDCQLDCFGVWGGPADIDECGVCISGGSENTSEWNQTCSDCAGVPNGDSKEDYCGTCDSEQSNDCVQGCDGKWGSGLVFDECGVCGGSGITEGDCDCNGNNYDCTHNPDDTSTWEGACGGIAEVDECGVCDDYTFNDCQLDCFGVWGGPADIDECGVCNGDGVCDCEDGNTSCECCCLAGQARDCTGECDGDTVVDECDVCDGSGIAEGDCDCNGNIYDCTYNPDDTPTWEGACGGIAEVDECGVCDEDDLNDCQSDCFGEWGANAEIDECGMCISGGSGNNGEWNQTCSDCAGVPNGDSMEDNCGTCDSEQSNDCLQGCDGNWGSGLVFDECGVCGVDGSSCLDIKLHLLPDEFGIKRIFPNPFNPVTQIQYDISAYAFVKVWIFDIQGREVALLMNEYQSPGHYNITWHASNHASGMYIVAMVIQSEENSDIFRDMRKILYLK